MQLNAKLLGIALFAIGASVAGYAVGLSTGRAEGDFQRYDALLSDLGNQIFIYDALAIREPEKAQTVLTATIESNFNALVDLYVTGQFPDFQDLRCAVTQRMRAFRKAGVVVGDDRILADKGYDATRLNAYLANECPGEPNRANWAEGKDAAKQPQQVQR